MTPSKYQVNIYSAARETNDNLGISAVAGSGKSTVLVDVVGEIPKHLTVLMLAFNKDIVSAIKPKVMAKHPRARVCTINAFGMGICKSNIRGIGDVDKEKTEKVTKSFFDMNSPKVRKWYYSLKGAIVRLTELFRSNLIWPDQVDEKMIREIADTYGMELPSTKPAFFELVSNVYSKCSLMTTYIDFRDQVFLPIYMDLPIPHYDVVLGDEVQDWDPGQIELIRRAGDRFILVGDPRQSIYGWRGAMRNAMDTMLTQMSATRLPLSVCYRCPRAVIREAQKIVPEIEACDFAPEGIVDLDVRQEDFRKKVKDGDFVLSRVTSALVPECLRLIRQKRKAVVKGKEIGDQLVVLIEKLTKDDAEDIVTFNRRLSQYQINEIARLTQLDREDDIIILNDKVETILALMEECATVADIKKQIERVFTDVVGGVIFMTIHKAKGLQSPRVWILAPELLPHPGAKKDWQREEERNLEYVAKTRSCFIRAADGRILEQGELYAVVKPTAAPKYEPRQPACSKCNTILLEKQDGIVISLVCPNKECVYRDQIVEDVAEIDIAGNRKDLLLPRQHEIKIPEHEHKWWEDDGDNS